MKFIRKNGRIIPIKDKPSGLGTAVRAGAVAVAAGTVAGLVGGKLAKQSLKFAVKSSKSIMLGNKAMIAGKTLRAEKHLNKAVSSFKSASALKDVAYKMPVLGAVGASIGTRELLDRRHKKMGEGRKIGISVSSGLAGYAVAASRFRKVL